MKKLLAFWAAVSITQAANAQSLDPYITDSVSNVFTNIVTIGGNGIIKPNDLDFNPAETNSPMELWVINEGTENSGGNTVTYLNAGQPNQTFQIKKDGNAWHFMSLPSALAFSETGDWGTSANVFSANHNSVPFTGPSLWSSDFSVYAVNHGPGTNGSHLDMLHQSPYGMGIAADTANVFWVFDGYNSTIVRYDFALDHGPGNSYHDDGMVHFYDDVSVSRDPNLPAHMVMDKSDKMLYICDNGNNRLLRMDTRSGNKKRDLAFNFEPLAQRWEMENVQWDILTANVQKPCGIDVYGDRMVVGDNATGEIIIFDISNTPALTEVGRIKVPHSPNNIRGLKVGPDGQIWFVDYTTRGVYHIENSKVGPLNVADVTTAGPMFRVYPNPSNGQFKIEGLFNDEMDVLVFDGSGRAVYSASLTQGNQTFNIRNAEAGMYWIQVSEKSGKVLGRQKWLLMK